jgi:Protein of unknown function (DUF732)
MFTMLRSLIVIFGALAMAIASPPVTRADAADDQFVNAVAAQGITGNRGAIIAAGHTVCDEVAPVATRRGKSKGAQLDDVMNALNVGPYEGWFVISAAKSIYCPQYLGVRV